MESVKKAGSAIRTFLINGFSRNKAENFLPRDNSKTDKGFAPVLRVNYIKRKIFTAFPARLKNQRPFVNFSWIQTFCLQLS